MQPEAKMRAAFRRAGPKQDFLAFYADDLPVILALTRAEVEALLDRGDIKSSWVRSKPGVRIVSRQHVETYLLNQYTAP